MKISSVSSFTFTILWDDAADDAAAADDDDGDDNNDDDNDDDMYTLITVSATVYQPCVSSYKGEEKTVFLII